MKKRVGVYIVLAVMASVWGILKFYSATETVKEESGGSHIPLYLYAMSDYFPEEFIRRFTAKTRCEVHYDTFSSNEELLAKLQAGATGYDIVVPSDYMVTALIEGKFLSALDKGRIPNIKNLATDFKSVPYDKGLKYSIPYTWGTTGLIWNTKHVKEDVTSWDVLFKKQYAGHISLLDDEREVLGAMLYKLGYSSNTTKKSELEEAQKLLIKLKPDIRLFASDPKQHLYSENVWIAQIYSGDAEQIIKNNPEFKYVVPKEGAIGWIDNLAIPVGAPDIDCAYAFIDFVLDAETAKLITSELRYSSPNTAVESSDLDARLKPSYLRKLSATHFEFLNDLGNNGQMWTQLWTEAKSH